MKIDKHSAVFGGLYFPSTVCDKTWSLGTIKIPWMFWNIVL